VDPENVAVLIRLGVAHAQAQEPERAVAVFETALALDEHRVDAHNNLGNVLVALGRIEEAVDRYQQALALSPDYADAYSNLGHAFVKLGRFEEAVTSFRQAAAIAPVSANDQQAVADALLALKRFEEAEAHYRALLEIDPAHAVAHSNLGVVLQKLGRLDDALAHCAKAIAIRPDYAVGHRNMGFVLHKLKRLTEAVDCFRKALHIDADDVDAHYNLGNVQQDLGRVKEAESSYRRALAIRPEFAGAHNNLGNVLLNLRRYGEAETSYRQALAIAPDYLNAHSNLAVCLHRLGRHEDAMAHCRRVLEIRPDHADAHVNLGASLFDLGRLDEARDHYRQALDTEPDHADAHWNNALLNLLQGNFESGWAQYEWRWQAQQMPPARQLEKPVWLGDELAGRTLLLHAEQGFGDTIQFSRYATTLVEGGAYILFEVPRSLCRLMAGLAGGPEILGRGDALPSFDCHAPLLEMPRLLETTLESIPTDVPYLAAAPALEEQWAARLGPRNAFRLGIVWAGNPNHFNDRNRSVEPALFRLLTALPDVSVYSLQVGREGEAERVFGKDVTNLAPRLTDFADTAAAIKALDLVISVDTAVAHIAGALGQAVWVLLPFMPDWRWLLDRADSPWYPTARLYRQPKPGDWQSVIERVASDLARARNEGSISDPPLVR